MAKYTKEEALKRAQARLDARQGAEQRLQAQEPPPGVLDYLAGAGEVGLQGLTGGLSMIPAGIAGIGAMLPGGRTPEEAVESTSDYWTYQPRTQAADIISEKVAAVAEPLVGAIADAPTLQTVREPDASGVRVGGALGGYDLEDDPDFNPVAATVWRTAVEGGPAVMTGGRAAMMDMPRGPLTRRQQVLEDARAEGYVAPLSDVRTSGISGSGVVEGLAGKPRMQAMASAKNQAVTNRLAAEALDLPPGAEITRDVLKTVRKQAGEAYAVLDDVGTVTTDQTYRAALNNAVADLKLVSRDFDVLGKVDDTVNEVMEIAAGLDKPTFQASSGLKASQRLRELSSKAYDANDNMVGAAYRQIAKAVEDAIDGHLQKFGDPDVISNFRNARQQIAKSYTIQAALDADGFVSAQKLANQLQRGAPLSGRLRDIARFAEEFPKSAKVIRENPINFGALSTILSAGGGGALLAGSPSGLLVAGISAARPAIRAGLLSDAGQKMLNRQRGRLTTKGETAAGLTASGVLADYEEED